MKFWQKTFIGFLTVFIVSIDVCLYLTSQYSFSLNMKGETDRSLGEYHFIMNGISETMNSISYRTQTEPTPSSIGSFVHSYANYYRKQKVFLQLNRSNKILFTNIPPKGNLKINKFDLRRDEYKIKVLPIGEKNYLYIYGNIGGQYKNYFLSYVRDLSELYANHSQLTRYLIMVSVFLEVILALILLLLSKSLTHPINVLQSATRKIANGIYNERIKIQSRDEFRDLADNFNVMTDSIQDKITELAKNAQDKQRLIDNLAHELRTPITAIRGYAEYLQNANTSEQNRIKAVNYIVSEADRMKNLSFKLLDLALVRNGELDVEEIDTLKLFLNVKSIVTQKLNEKGIDLVIQTSLKVLKGDAVLLQSLLVNLINNAVNASKNDTKITLSAYFDSIPILEVKDSGCGMSDENIALVCEPFYRIDKARSRSFGGIGLGLSLCREIAHLHGAELKIISHVNEGTTVKIAFTTSLQPSENSVTHKEV